MSNPYTPLPREPDAARLRREGKLWPECLTDAELRHELDTTRMDSSPIGTCMLRDEEARRRGRHLQP